MEEEVPNIQGSSRKYLIVNMLIAICDICSTFLGKEVFGNV